MPNRPELAQVRCLSFHSAYQCQNTGVCCSSGWEIAVEQPVELALTARLRNPGARLPNGPDGFLPMADPPPGCRVSLRRSDTSGSCWFRDRSDHRCAIHREFGVEALPSACRQFPRVCVLEPDCVSLSLSHYCPTAAGLLFQGGEGFSLVSGARAGFPPDWPYEGLDARMSYPPLLRPGVLLGFDGLRAFEEGAVEAFARHDLHTSLNLVHSVVEEARSWRPGGPSLPVLIRTAFSRPAAPSREVQAQDTRSILASSSAEGSPVAELPTRQAATRQIPAFADLALRKYLAARLIAAWVTFQAEDLRTVANYLRLCLDTVLLFEATAPLESPESTRWKEAVRSADLWILHHCDPERLARNLG